MPSHGVPTGQPLWEAAMHYPHRTSRIKRKRSIGFRARMKTTNGLKMMNRKRAAGRSLNIADKHI
jgi:ribosomal protein L34